MSWLLIAGVTVILLIYRFLYQHYHYWTRQGVPQSKPWFILGDLAGIIFRKHAPPELIDMMYKLNPNSRYIGMYEFFSPSLIIRDPDLIKQIIVKDYEDFLDHRNFASSEKTPLLSKNLGNLKGQKWQEMRMAMSPSFTSSKMKFMFSLISQNGEQFVKHFLDKENKVFTVEMKSILSKFSNDVIANTVFGIECDSLQNPHDEFYLMGKEATDLTGLRKRLAFVGFLFAPNLSEFLGLKIFSQKLMDYFIKIIKDHITSREKFGIVRPDMISVLLEARKDRHDKNTVVPDTDYATVQEPKISKNRYQKAEITDEDIASQAFVFFFAGFDNVSTLMSFMAYELAVNQEVQEKLRCEVDTTREKCQGKITYDALSAMKYLDMVVSETLRKWPSTPATDRVCTRQYTIEPKTPNEKSVRLKVGDLVVIPIYPIQRDPQYYPDPERFDPERFNETNKHKITPYTYLPFGAGPRACIASRFALLQTKIVFFYLLWAFEILPTEKTQIPIRFDRKSITMASEKGFWLSLKRRV